MRAGKMLMAERRLLLRSSAVLLWRYASLGKQSCR